MTETYFWLESFWLFLFAAMTLYSLIRTVENHKRELAYFLTGLRQGDFSATYKITSSDAINEELQDAYQQISNHILTLREEKESEHHFLQAVVENSSIAMIGFLEKTGEINLMNEAAKQLFNKHYLKNIDKLKTIDSEISQKVAGLEAGQKTLTKFVHNNELIKLSIAVKQLKMRGSSYKFVTFQNINAELDEQELESWQKIIRVLTHEIKNSAIPISTLTEVVNQIIIDEDGNLKDLSKLDAEDLDDIKVGIHTVEKRSKGLVKFVNAYGELARVPKPAFESINVQNLIDDILALLGAELKSKGIEVQLEIDSAPLLADKELIEQDIINLIKNAKEALSNTTEAEIKINYQLYNDQKIISIEDNGPGIEAQVLENIFVPFFTTKKEGSGIGLSLSRQIMRAHKGNLTVKSTPGFGTQFSLIF